MLSTEASSPTGNGADVTQASAAALRGASQPQRNKLSLHTAARTLREPSGEAASPRRPRRVTLRSFLARPSHHPAAATQRSARRPGSSRPQPCGCSRRHHQRSRVKGTGDLCHFFSPCDSAVFSESLQSPAVTEAGKRPQTRQHRCVSIAASAGRSHPARELCAEGVTSMRGERGHSPATWAVLTTAVLTVCLLVSEGERVHSGLDVSVVPVGQTSPS